ncbi:MAG: hypothetical protein BWK73_47225 [Thiothrix lacustris]|uniref:Sel1 repeat family protein n=1 Tax=Thiothrix lacustris TaxID=525917 RepID=A0A1Y1QA02_9GAMM|nr:MAG: hypothetical protein BWK73_47225 [Thiothrix lacustris]
MYLSTFLPPPHRGITAVVLLILALPALAQDPSPTIATLSSAANILAPNTTEAATQFAKAKERLSKKPEGVDLQQGLDWLEQSAQQAHAPALFELANLYENGSYVKQDSAKAVELYEQAAKQGHLDAQYNVGLLYLRVIKNTEKASYWLEQAAQQHDSEAQYNLALLHDVAKSTQADPDEATHWYTQAAQQRAQKCAI